MNADGRSEQRPLSQFGLYVLALMKLYRVSAAELARAVGISKGTVSELMRPYPGRAWRPSEKVLWGIYSYFYGLYKTQKETEPGGPHIPAGWHYGMRNAALFTDLVPDILLLQLWESVIAACPGEQSPLPAEISAYSPEDLEELESLFVEGLAYIQDVRRRSRQHP